MASATLINETRLPAQIIPAGSRRYRITVASLVAFVLAMIVQGVLGTAGAGLVFLCALFIVSQDINGLGSVLRDEWTLLILPFYLLITVVWSWAGMASFKLAPQLILTMLPVLVISRRLTQQQLFFYLMGAISFGLFVSLALGKMGSSVSGAVNVGFAGSKNALAYLSQATALIALTNVLDKQQRMLIRMAGLAIYLAAAVVTVRSHATTMLLTLPLASGIMVGVQILKPMPRFARILLVCIAGFSAIALGALIITNSQEILTNSLLAKLGKSRDLTGRTEIWAEALHQITLHPVIGQGYRAFWLGDSLEADTILRNVGVEDGHGFSFHSQYLETMVDGGVAGAVFLTITFFTALLRGLFASIQKPSPFSGFRFGYMMLMLAGLPTEVDFLPWSIQTMMFCIAATRPPAIAASPPPPAPKPVAVTPTLGLMRASAMYQRMRL